mgnify:CR=1 FL=1
MYHLTDINGQDIYINFDEDDVQLDPIKNLDESTYQYRLTVNEYSYIIKVSDGDSLQEKMDK